MMATKPLFMFILIISAIGTCTDAFLDATLLLDRLKLHYWRSTSGKITSYASTFSRRSSLAYIDQLHRRKGRRKTSLLATQKKSTGKEKANGSTSEPKLKRNEVLFQQRLSELKAFIDENGHGSIPTPYEGNPPLGVWAANLRRQFVIREHAEQESSEYKGFLTDERLDVLKDSGFDFTPLTERQFKIRLEELKEFKEKYGHTCVPEKFEENLALGTWVSNMRTQYKKKRAESESTPEEGKVNGDNEPGIVKERYSKNMLEHEIVPTKKRRRRQRSKRASQLDDEKERLLEEIGFVWNAKDRKWWEMLEWAKVYAVVNYELASSRDENASISLDATDGSFNRTELDERDTLLLDNYYTFVQNIQDPSLLPYFHPQDEILDLLLDENYVESVLGQTQHLHSFPVTEMQHNSTVHDCPLLDYRVPVNDTLHYSLRIWMVNQRSNYHRRFQNATDIGFIPSTMTDQRQQALEEINFPWSGRHPNRCEEIRYEIEHEEKNRIEMEKTRRREKKMKEEQEKIEQLKIRQDTTPLAPVTPVVAEDDIMSLWGAEDDEYDDIW